MKRGHYTELAYSTRGIQYTLKAIISEDIDLVLIILNS